MVQCVSSHAGMLRSRTPGLEVFELLVFFAGSAGPALHKGPAFEADGSLRFLRDLCMRFQFVAYNTLVSIKTVPHCAGMTCVRRIPRHEPIMVFQLVALYTDFLKAMVKYVVY